MTVRATGRVFRYQADAVVEELVNGVSVRSIVVDDAGAPTKLTIPVGQPNAGTYLPTWSGHGDLLALWQVQADGSLTLANSVTYDTWGKPTIAGANGIPDLGFRRLYVGRADVWWDDTYGAGLTYMHARSYVPALGRFLQPDPIAAEANLYGYAGNNPVTYSDSLGTFRRPDDVECLKKKAELVRAILEVLTRARENLWGRVDDPLSHAKAYKQAQGRLVELWKKYQDGPCPDRVGSPRVRLVQTWRTRPMPPTVSRVIGTPSVMMKPDGTILIFAATGLAGAALGGYYLAHTRVAGSMLLR